MTLQEFFDKYNGKGIDFDGFYGNQCMDLAEEYNRDVVGALRLTGNAADVWENYPVDNYERFLNTPDGVPQLGDIVLWNKNVGGGFGHIAIFKEGDIDNFTSFDQNWPTGSNCHFQSHVYTNVTGWLRPKVTDNNALTECLKQHDLLVTEANEKNATINNLNSQIADLHQQLTTKDGEISNVKTQLANESQAKEIALNQAKDYLILQENYNVLKKDYDSDKINWNAQATRDKQQITTLQNKLENIKTKGILNKIIFIFS